MARVGLVQHACSPDGSREDHLAAAERGIREAAARGAELIVTQELFAGPYFPQRETEENFALAEPVPGPTSQWLSALAQELGVLIVGSLFERRAPGLFHNTTVLVDGIRAGGGIVAAYRKMHIPDDPGFFEKYHFTPGDAAPLDVPVCEGAGAGAVRQRDGWVVAEAAGLRAGLLVCWDQWFPEAARLTSLLGAEVLLYPTAIGWHRDEPADVRAAQLDAWRTVQRSHAIANGVYVCAVNRCGTEGDLTFWGGSFMCDPAGVVIAEAPADDPAVIVAEVDPAAIERQRVGWPFLRDRRVDAYGGLGARWSGGL